MVFSVAALSVNDKQKEANLLYYLRLLVQKETLQINCYSLLIFLTNTQSLAVLVFRVAVLVLDFRTALLLTSL